MSVFDKTPEDMQQLRKMNERMVNYLDDYTESIAYGFEEIVSQKDDLEKQYDALSDELEMLRYQCDDYAAELRFLGKFISESDTSIPMENHPINFGQFLNEDDPRRDAISCECDLE